MIFRTPLKLGLYREHEMGDFIRNASTNELRAELERREKEARIEAVPKARLDANWDDVIGTMVTAVARRSRGEGTKDLDNWIFEAVAEALYEKDAFWKWWNAQEVDGE